jgi:meso-butanediol dehydrogenase/(S,S)-butanediol dehydrogenase/diacetyl reductase
MARLLGKVVLVTGSGMGIGAAIAELCAAEGAHVVAADVDPEAGLRTSQRIAAASGSAISVVCDVARADQVQRAVETTVQTYGGIDVLINNAGISLDGTVLDTAEDDWDRVIAVNLKGVYLCSKYAVPHIVNRGGGAVVNIASVAGLAGLRRGAAYNASKAGVVMLTKNMALDLAPHGIRVNCVCPGATVTPMYEASIARAGDAETVRRNMTLLRPLGRLGEARETAQAVLFLMSDESSYITGTVVVVDGGVMAQFAGQIRPRPEPTP